MFFVAHVEWNLIFQLNACLKVELITAVVYFCKK
jgi:hypothetical protein